MQKNYVILYAVLYCWFCYGVTIPRPLKIVIEVPGDQNQDVSPVTQVPFLALTMLVGRQEGHPDC